MIKNTSKTYGSISKLAHWIIGIIILSMLVVGFTMTSMEPSDSKWELYGAHKAVGLLVLFLVVLRFLWRVINIQPDLPIDLPNWQKFSSRMVHYLLYVCMFLMPISGVLMSIFAGHDVKFFALFTITAVGQNKNIADIFYTIHETTALIFVNLIGVHILAALYHHFIRKDNVFMKMIK